MLQRIIRTIVLALLRLYYPRIEVEGRENLPTSGPVIFVLNHPNGLLDPLLLIATLGRPVSFLAKNTLFNNWLGRTACQAFGALPVYRQRDAGAGDNTQAKNDLTFARCHQLLRDGVALALFPEGTTHSEAQLLPLRTGSARIALGAEDSSDWRLGLNLVPVGLWYEDKRIFRSSVLLIVGKPWTIADHAATYRADREQAVDDLTADIAVRLGEVVFQAGNADLLRGLPVMVQWTIDHLSLGARERRKQPAALLAATERLAADNAPRMAELSASAHRYARTLRLLGISDPWSLDLPVARRTRYLAMGALLVVSAPVAVLGLIISYIPYRMGGIVSARLTDEDQVLGTIKLIAGLVLVPIGWIVAALLVGFLLGASWGWLLLALAPLLAYIALRWSELWREFRASASATWLRVFRPDLTAQLVARRQVLSERIVTAVLQLND
jgi:1-acyl-sn-glycerol-3-phosphate acyltransferase